MADDRGPEIRAIVIFLCVLCVITVALRCYTRKFIVKRFAVEDWLAVVALVRSIITIQHFILFLGFWGRFPPFRLPRPLRRR